MTKTNKPGLYLHIPFCERKCRYCDFLSFGCNESRILSEYAAALMKEIGIRAEKWRYREVDSVYIGGGTPSLLSPWDIGRLMDCLNDNFNITEDAEITIEANPATLSDEKMERYLRKGINRLSIGVQSFENSVLKVLGRIHDKNDAFYAFQRARKAGFDNINLDIMFGVPGQTMKMWKDTVRQCTFLRPEHISLYSLQIEEGTEMYDMVYRDGSLEPVPDVIDREMYHTALKMLRRAGYDHYEISNAAVPGRESRHNMKYWSYVEYMGIGLGASSFVEGSRFRNCSRMSDYIKAIKEDVEPVDVNSVEHYSATEEMGIFMFTGLRKTEGVDLNEFRQVFGKDLFSVYDRGMLERYKGMLVLDGDRIYISERGMDISNRIMTEFV